jgi:hypothetical protein
VPTRTLTVAVPAAHNVAGTVTLRLVVVAEVTVVLTPAIVTVLLCGTALKPEPVIVAA